MWRKDVFARLKVIFMLVIIVKAVYGQGFYFGNDLSYANQMEDCGAVFKEDGIPTDVFRIFADHGTNLVRLRLWVDPSWQNSLVQPAGVKSQYSDLEDVKEAIRRSKDAGMQVMLGFQLSDVWADPGRQLIPARWLGVANNLSALIDSVYNYVTNVLNELDSDTLMPEIVKIGNETNGGILVHTTMDQNWVAGGSVSSSWSRHAQLFNAAIKAVRDVSHNTDIKPKIALHFSNRLSGQVWNFQNIINNGVTDFDIMGISYYYSWHDASISQLQSTIQSLKNTFPGYDPMVVETGYLWTTENFDGQGNIIREPDPEYLPVIPEKQLEYMIDYTRAVMKGGGIGVVFWEPDWVSTPCRTPWGVGSSQDHVVFFDPVNNNFMVNGGGRWTEPQFYDDLNTVKAVFKTDMTGQDVSEGVYITGTFTGEPWQIIPMANEGNNIYSYFTYLSSGDSGLYYFLNRNDWSYRESVPYECAEWNSTDRGYKIPDHNTVFSSGWGECVNGVSDAPQIRFMVDMAGQDVSRGVFVVGDMDNWNFTRMSHIRDGIYSCTFKLTAGDDIAYYYITTNNWNTGWKDYRETVPEECANSAEIKGDPGWTSDRAFIVPFHDSTITNVWGSCSTFDPPVEVKEYGTDNQHDLAVYPNPTTGDLYIGLPGGINDLNLEIISYSGSVLKSYSIGDQSAIVSIHISDLSPGCYLAKFITNSKDAFYRILVLLPR